MIPDRVARGFGHVLQVGQPATAAGAAIEGYRRRVDELRQIGRVIDTVRRVVVEQREIGRITESQVVIAAGHHVGIAVLRDIQRGVGGRLTIFLHHDAQRLAVTDINETAALDDFGGPQLLAGGHLRRDRGRVALLQQQRTGLQQCLGFGVEREIEDAGALLESRLLVLVEAETDRRREPSLWRTPNR